VPIGNGRRTCGGDKLNREDRPWFRVSGAFLVLGRARRFIFKEAEFLFFWDTEAVRVCFSFRFLSKTETVKRKASCVF
jgi:hypothetical protein